MTCFKKIMTTSTVCFSFLLALFSFSSQLIGAAKTMENKKAIVLTSFGTSYPKALDAIINIEKEVKKSFPNYTIHHAFTSHFIRKKWHKRQNDKGFLAQYGDISQKFLKIKSPLATIANLQDQGYADIIVQPTHIVAGEEFSDLNSTVEALNDIKTVRNKHKPFKNLVISRPALGKPSSKFPYHEDLYKAAKALASDVAKAKKIDAALVYMGHGNEHFSTGVYSELEVIMNKLYPSVPTVIGLVEGYPSFDHVKNRLSDLKAKKVFMKPLMVVAGDHATNDMASSEEDSWKTLLEKMGMSVKCELLGLGSNDKWAALYSSYIKELTEGKVVSH